MAGGRTKRGVRGLVLAVCAGTAWIAAGDDRLPITEITLYRSGVGYFAHQGMVEGDQSVTLRFRTEQVNDILKSMVLMDLGGGRIDGVSYGSKEPLEKRLSSFAVDISDNPNLAELLDRLRGARVALGTLDGRIEGVVLGVEMREKALGDSKASVPFVNLVTDRGLRSVDVTAASGLEILDEQLAQELNKALMALSEHRADTSKSVDVRFSGDGARRVIVAYVHEMPVWKTSYRLILPDDSEGGQATIQAWAIVENTTDEDWKNVRLSLVAGQPVGFTMDLYQPLFVPRAEVPVPVMAGLLPTVYEEGVADQAMLGLEVARRGVERERAAGRELRADAAPMAKNADFAGGQLGEMFKADYLAASMASAGEIGEVFQYTLDAPISLERQQSAMLPILSGAIEGRRVSIYNRQRLGEHPMRGVEMTNSTGLQLMPGPISVFDGSAFAGDAQTGHVSAGEKRLISYAVDLEVDVQSEDRSQTRIDSLRIVRGNLVQQTTYETGVRHTLTNNDRKRARTVLIEHEKMDGWELVTPSRASETTENLYRFEVEIPAGKSGAFEVLFRRVDRQTMGIDALSIEQLVVHQRNGRISDKAIEAIREAMRLNSEVRRAEERIREVEREREEISQDQSRIRQNMSGIDRTSQLYKRYIEKLDAQETRLEEMGNQADALRRDLEGKREAYRAYLANLSVE